MDLEVFKGKADVFVGTLRGRKDKDAWQWATGVGGVAVEDLVKIDITPHGTTWLWEPLAMFLEVLRNEIINAAKPPSARLLLLDLSGSMRDHQELLKKMWAAVPRSGLAVDGVEIMVVTDGEDTDSSGKYHGNDGLFELLIRATALGFNTGIPEFHDDKAIGTLHITAINIGKPLKFTEELKGNVTVIETQDPQILVRVVRSPLPRCYGRPSEKSVREFWPELTPAEQAEIDAVQDHLGKPYDLAALFDFVLCRASGTTLDLARAAMVDFLKHLILDDEWLIVARRGPAKQIYHTEINSMLYSLKLSKIVCVNEEKERIWSRGPNYGLIESQVRAMLPKPFVLDEAVASLLASAEPEQDIRATLKRYPEETENIISALVQSAKRVKQ